MDFEMDDDPKIEEDCYAIFGEFTKAIIANNQKIINSLITKEGILQGKFTFDSVTLLHIATKRGTSEIVQQLCKHGAGVNIQNKKGETPIFHAIKNSTEMVKILIDNNAKVNITCKKGVTPLHLSLLHGTEETLAIILNKLINEKSIVSTFFDFTSFSKLTKIEKIEKTIELMKILLNNKKIFGLKEKDYPLLILFAAKTGSAYILELVLRDCGEYLNLMSNKERDLRNKSKKSIYYRKERYVALKPVELNYQGYFDRTALHYAVREQLSEVVEFLLKEGADPNCKTRDKLTPLHYAASLENKEICQHLLNFGADVNPNCCRHGNPIYLISGRSEVRNLLNSGDGYYYDEFHNTFMNRMNSYYEPETIFNLEIMKLLIDNDGDLECKGDEGTTPFLEACRAGNLEMVKILLKFKANFHCFDNEKNTALHHAAIGCSFDIIDILLEKNIEIDVRNQNDYTPLMLAVQNERRRCLEVIEYLVDCGADVNAKNCSGATALHIAAYFDWADVAECLLELGADWSMKYDTENSPVMGNILSSFYCSGIESSRKLIISSIALKEKELGDCVKCYVGDDEETLKEAYDYFQKSKIEIEKLRGKQILEELRISYYDFLTRDFYNSVQLIKNEDVRQILNRGDYKKEFSCYNYLLERRFKRCELMENSIDKIVDFVTNCGNVQLPILAVDKILRRLRTIDFRIFARVLTKKRF